MFQKFLFPFSSTKYAFLEQKLWHRLAKITMIILLIVISFLCFLYVLDEIQYSQQVRPANKVDMGTTTNTTGKMTVADFAKQKKTELVGETSSEGRDYSTYSDEEFVQKYIAKYPEYADKIDMGTTTNTTGKMSVADFVNSISNPHSSNDIVLL